ncbi:Uncharacterized protein FKW44_005933 [Caligus rogercresseyi]|uniref:Uncharacterized protein n=1 Tax=Caligus rogercresseyi TaxID=217165 RepID=A0A7T8KCP6_CALRO|nr:Uncharacterized protein FKW44_005933 [Caligus rogercresseyi]
MTSEGDISINIRAHLDAGQSPISISRYLNVSKAAVYNIRGKESIQRKPGSCG